MCERKQHESTTGEKNNYKSHKRAKKLGSEMATEKYTFQIIIINHFYFLPVFFSRRVLDFMYSIRGYSKYLKG